MAVQVVTVPIVEVMEIGSGTYSCGIISMYSTYRLAVQVATIPLVEVMEIGSATY